MSIIDLIGNTPIVKLDRINPNPHVRIYAKLEGNNSGGSSKDRIAHFMIMDAEQSGTLKKDHIYTGADKRKYWYWACNDWSC